MKLENLKIRIEQVETDIFLLDMKDTWEQSDFDRNELLKKELEKLKEEEKQYEKR